MKQKLGEIEEKIPDTRFLLLLGILAVATYLRFRYAFFDGMWIDEGRYSRIGKEVSRHFLDYSVTSEWHGQITGHPPLYPYLIALANLAFSPEVAARIISPITSVAGIALTYLFGREVSDRETGLIAAALLSVNPIFWFLSQRVLIGATLTTMYTATMLAFWYGLEDRKYSRYALLAAGPLSLLTVLTKQPGYALGVILPAYLIYRKQEAIRDAWEKKSIRDSDLMGVLTNRDYYLSAGLGIVLILPWMLRNISTCGFPLCSFKRALQFAGRDITNPAVAHGQGLYFFMKGLPGILTVPVFAFAFSGVIYSILKRYDLDARDLGYRSALYIGSVGFLSVIETKLVPMALLTGLALFSRRRFGKLAWIWTGVGIGFMSIPTVKDPRYIVFTMPALVLLASLNIREICRWVGERYPENDLLVPVLTATVVVLVAFNSYSSGLGDVQRGGYAHLEPAGEFMSERLGENENVFATSDGQNRFYVHPSMAYMPPNNRSKFESMIVDKNITYVEVDLYEPAQPKWTQTEIAPYRLPNSVRADLRNREITQREVMNMFQQTPDYLVPVRTYGEARSPISRGSQPMVIVYRVNRTALQ